MGLCGASQLTMCTGCTCTYTLSKYVYGERIKTRDKEEQDAINFKYPGYVNI